jgi:uncharacterized protein
MVTFPWKSFSRLCGLVFALSLALVLLAPNASAQSPYPSRTDPVINDYAELLTAKDASTIRSLVQELRNETGIELVLVTIGSIDDYPVSDTTIESFATNLFNTWGIGSRERNDGILLLVARNDRKVRIELGSGFPSELSGSMAEVLDTFVLPHFRNDDYSRGILQGVQGIVGGFTNRDLVSLSDGAGLQGESDVIGVDPLGVLGLLGGGIGVAGAAGVGYRYYRMNVKRRCSNCSMDMTKLDEETDDLYLDTGQRIEEALRSINYDVWKCPHCAKYEVFPRPRWFSSYEQCPECQYKTVEVRTDVIAEPTYSSTGSERVSLDCHHCQYHEDKIVVLPMLTETTTYYDSGGSSDSSGGGSSSGDGATGSW